MVHLHISTSVHPHRLRSPSSSSIPDEDHQDRSNVVNNLGMDLPSILDPLPSHTTPAPTMDVAATSLLPTITYSPIPPILAAASVSDYGQLLLEHAVEAICRWSSTFSPQQVYIMTSAAFPMVNLATINAITRGVARAGIFPSATPQWQGTHASTPSPAISTPTLYHTAMQPSLEDSDLFNIIIDLQDPSHSTQPSATVADDPGTPLNNKGMNTSPTVK